MGARSYNLSRIAAATGVRAGSLALVLALVGGPGRGLAQADRSTEYAPRAWTERSVNVGLSDAFLGFPTSNLRDDNGFVANLRLSVDLPHGDHRHLQLGLSQQLITQRGGPHRVDEGKVYAAWQRFDGPTPLQGRTLGWRLGVGVIGNLGGSVMQDWAHRSLFVGRLLSGRGANELQYQYPRGYEVLALVGGQASVAHPLANPWFVRSGVEATVGFGTGLFGELLPFVALGVATEFVELELREAVGLYGTNIRTLTMPGGYVTGVPQSQPSVHLKIHGPRWLPGVLTLDLEWNHGDSHQHVGGITVGAKF
jgi:hypothetical protein